MGQNPYTVWAGGGYLPRLQDELIFLRLNMSFSDVVTSSLWRTDVLKAFPLKEIFQSNFLNALIIIGDFEKIAAACRPLKIQLPIIFSGTYLTHHFVTNTTSRALSQNFSSFLIPFSPAMAPSSAQQPSNPSLAA